MTTPLAIAQAAADTWRVWAVIGLLLCVALIGLWLNEHHAPEPPASFPGGGKAEFAHDGRHLTIIAPDGSRYLTRIERLTVRQDGNYALALSVVEPRAHRSNIVLAVVAPDGGVLNSDDV